MQERKITQISFMRIIRCMQHNENKKKNKSQFYTIGFERVHFDFTGDFILPPGHISYPVLLYCNIHKLHE